MNEQELRAIVERLVTELAPGSGGHAPAISHSGAEQLSAGAPLPDITQVNLREQYLVKNPENGGAFWDLKRKPPPDWGSHGRGRDTKPPPCSVSVPTTRQRRTRCFLW